MREREVVLFRLADTSAGQGPGYKYPWDGWEGWELKEDPSVNKPWPEHPAARGEDGSRASEPLSQARLLSKPLWTQISKTWLLAETCPCPGP